MDASKWPALLQALMIVAIITASTALMAILPGLALGNLVVVGFTTGLAMAVIHLLLKKRKEK